MFNIDDHVECILVCSHVTVGHTYKVIDPLLHPIFPAGNLMDHPDPLTYITIVDDNGEINAYRNNRFQLVKSIIDFLSITRTICGG